MKQDVLANTVGAMALAIVDGAREAVAQASGLEPMAGAALNAIGFRKGCSVGEVAQVVGLTHAGAVRCIDRLEALGLVERLQGADARTLALQLSRKGRARWNAQKEARMRWLRSVVGGLPVADRAALAAATEALLPRLATDAPAGERICRLCDESVCTPTACPIGDRCLP